MRPPGGILSPGESLIATESLMRPPGVFKFVEQPENNEKQDQKSKVKFKIMSLKVKGAMDYVPELFEEQRDQVTVEQILRVVFLEPERPCPALEKLKRQLAEAEAALEARKKPPEDTGPRIVGEGLVIDEWSLGGQKSGWYSTFDFWSMLYSLECRIRRLAYSLYRGCCAVVPHGCLIYATKTNILLYFLLSSDPSLQKERRERYLARQQVEGVVDSV
ncbi:Vesicle-associated protein 4-2 [Asimina triloba]